MFRIYVQIKFSASQHIKTPTTMSSATSVTSPKTTSSIQTTNVYVKKDSLISNQSVKKSVVMDSSSKASAMTTTPSMEMAAQVPA